MAKPHTSPVPIPEPCTVSELADALKLQASGRARVVRALQRLGIRPARVVGRTAIYPPGTIDKLRAELGEGVQQ